ncbi:MAG: Ig-like domain-containing protein [Rhizobiaceae bacterium]
MTTADKECRISFPGFMNGDTRIPATQVTLTRQPKAGKITVVSGQGLIYTPARGFKGKDTFCTRNKSPKMPGGTLSGCVTVTVR